MNKLDLITGTDDLRPIMMFVLLTQENCVATNAHILGVIPTKEIFSEEFINQLGENRLLIHREDYKKLNNATLIEWSDREKLIVKVYYKKNRPALIEFSDEDKEGAKYPRWDAVIPEKSGETAKMCVDPVLLLTLTKALGYKGAARLSYCGAANRAIIVEDCINGVETESYGIIMPVMDID